MTIFTRLQNWWNGPQYQPTTVHGKSYTLTHGGILTDPKDDWTPEEIHAAQRQERERFRQANAHMERKLRG